MAQRFLLGPYRVTLQRPYVLFLKVFNLRVSDQWLNCCVTNPTTVKSESSELVPRPPWGTNQNLNSTPIQQGKSPRVSVERIVCVSVHVGMWIENTDGTSVFFLRNQPPKDFWKWVPYWPRDYRFHKADWPWNHQGFSFMYQYWDLTCMSPPQVLNTGDLRAPRLCECFLLTELFPSSGLF